MIVLWLGLALLVAYAQVDTSRLNAGPSGAGDATNMDGASATEPVTNASPTPTSAKTETISTAPPVATTRAENWDQMFGVPAGFLSIAGFLLYFCGLTRARNSAHTVTLVLVGAIFALIGYAAAGFAIEAGGIYAHAPGVKYGLDHELGFMASGHYWGLMGDSGFFLSSDPVIADVTAQLFLGQAALLLIAVAAALGTGLERIRLAAAAATTFVIGLLIYPLFANWVWGDGWLTELGQAFPLGNGVVVQSSGTAYVHETAGTLALVFALILGARYGRFNREKISRPMPGHHVPSIVLGAVLLLLSWVGLADSASAMVNLLLAAAAGLAVTFLLNSGKRRPEPARLCQGLLGGAIATTGAGASLDPWAALAVGAIAALLVPATVTFLEKRRLDDPAGIVAVHGVGGIWAMLIPGLLANGLVSTSRFGGPLLNVKGLFYGGGGGQLAAQATGAAICFITVFGLGFICFGLIHKIIGSRIDVHDEVEGLDWPQTGALGYQPDTEPESLPPQS